MNNLLTPTSDNTAPPIDQLIQATTLVSEALKSGRLMINPDWSFNVAGANEAPALSVPGDPVLEVQKPVNKFVFNGKTWTLQFDGKAIIEPDRVGYNYVAQLLQRSGSKILVNDLVTGAYGEPVDVMREIDLLEGDVAIEGEDEECGDGPSGQVVTTEFKDEILPDKDRAIVLDILGKFEEELAVLKAKGSVDSVPEKEWQIEKTKEYLAKTRFGSKNVHFDGRAEKNRKSVGKAIKEAFEKIEKKNAALAEHFRKSIRTGVYCSYKPKGPVSWKVAVKWRPVAPSK